MASGKKNRSKPRVYVELTAYWGNDDVDSTIKLSRRRWKQIQEGASYSQCSSAWYEGSSFSVDWHFYEGEVSIYGEDAMECVVGLPVSNLVVNINNPEENDDGL